MCPRWDGVRTIRAFRFGSCLALGLTARARAAPTSNVGTPATLQVDLGSAATLDLVLIRGGQLQQGSPASEAGRNADEAPRAVTIGHDFYIGRTEVTVGQFQRFVEETGYRTEAETGKSGGFGFDGARLVQRPEFNWRNPGFVQTAEHPVTLVTFGDALAFVDWASKKGGRNFALPTEAEWEYAYRAGTTTAFYAGSGEDAASAIGWFKANAAKGTQPVAQKAANAFGLHDMGGNVYEWCRDWYGPYASGPVNDPELSVAPAGDKPRRVLRGGSWLKDAKNLRAAARYRNDPGSRNADNGFRVTASIEATASPAVPATSPSSADTSANTDGKGDRNPLSMAVLAFIAFVGLGALAFVVWMVRKWRRPRAMRGAPPGVTYRRVKDGFWLTAPSPLHGSTLHYRANVVGKPVRASVPIEPTAEGQFVYTGGAPGDVEAEQIVGLTAAQAYAAAMAVEAQVPRGRARRNDESDESDDSSYSDDVASASTFRGYPGAY
ncbi:MAG: formylglycine-generating enzyme family protein [Myxococcota bacterium]